MVRRSKTTREEPPNYQALAEFRYTLRRFLSFSATAARANGLSAPQHQALLAIKGFSSEAPITIGDLAERLDLRHHSAVGLVDRLAARRLVCRIPDVEDRRRVRLKVTAVGEEILERLSKVHRDEIRRLGIEWRSLLHKLDV